MRWLNGISFLPRATRCREITTALFPRFHSSLPVNKSSCVSCEARGRTMCTQNGKTNRYCPDKTEPLYLFNSVPELKQLDYDPTEEENEGLCRAFTLLDLDGDGVIDLTELEYLLTTWGRLPFDDDLAKILTYSGMRGCEGSTGMDFKMFKMYVTNQLADTGDEDELREAFKVFDDSSPPSGMVNVKKLRHCLKTEGVKATDDELDFLYREEDYWMLTDVDHISYEKLICKLLGKPCDSKFLDC